MSVLTKYITEMMSGAPQNLLSEMEQQSLRLPSPISYEGVVGESVPLLPLNLLIFCRKSAASLPWSGSMDRATNSHQHHRHVLIIALKGRGRVWLDSHGSMLEPGHTVLVSPYQKHSYTEVAPSKILWLFITFEHARSSLTESLRSRPAIPLNAQALRILRDLLSAWQTDQRDPSNILLLALFLQWIGRETPRRRRRDDPHESAISALVGKINRFAFEHRGRAVSIEEIACEVGMSPSHLRATFRQATGQSLGNHLRDFRLQYACSLMADKSRRLAEISEVCGYESQFSFSRAFHKAYGCPPRVYRARLTDRAEAPST